MDHLKVSDAEMAEHGIQFFPINRGGDITFHGPGQLVGYPILVGASRKRFIASVSPSEPDQRLGGSLAAHLLAARNGAKFIRAHDVAATLQALRVASAIEDAR